MYVDKRRITSAQVELDLYNPAGSLFQKSQLVFLCPVFDSENRRCGRIRSLATIQDFSVNFIDKTR